METIPEVEVTPTTPPQKNGKGWLIAGICAAVSVLAIVLAAVAVNSDQPLDLATKVAVGKAEKVESNDVVSQADQQCIDLLLRTDDALDPTDGAQVRQCRLTGHDPIWNAIGVWSSDDDYDAWRRTGEVPTCADLIGRPNVLTGGVLGVLDVVKCEEQ